ncbi:putative fucosyltransferase-like protein [Arachis hypogaea]|uniref:putative fucosyltransferase-like protein n=1 Tax=Arachis hypogaea TaxID=3818 RepID=UPI003B21056F
MGLVQNLRSSRTESTHEGLLVLSVQLGLVLKRKCSNLMPLVVAFVVIVEIAFLGRLNMAENAAMVTDFFYRSCAASVMDGADDLDFGLLVGRTNKKNSESESCKEWMVLMI